MGNLFKHLRTVHRHRHWVIHYAKKAGIFWQGLRHDLSKFSLTELIPSVKYYQGGRRSPNEREREVYGFSYAWLHHKGRNRHHFEYWYDYDKASNSYKPVKMPLKYVKEMFCDRCAASRVYLGKNYQPNGPLQYFIRNDTIVLMHRETGILLEKWLKLLAEKGEEVAFEEIRNTKYY